MKLFSHAKLTILFLLLPVVTACTSVMRGNVVTFHDGPLPAGETIRVEATDPAVNQSLEFRQYAGLINAKLEEIGYTPVAFGEDAELIAQVDYSVEMGPLDVDIDRGRPYVRYHFYYGRYYDPFYFGVLNSWGPELRTTRNYLRKLSLNIVRNDEERSRLFEARVESVGSDDRLPEIMPYLVTALFTNFPGENGVTKVVTIEMDE